MVIVPYIIIYFLMRSGEENFIFGRKCINDAAKRVKETDEKISFFHSLTSLFITVCGKG